MAKDRISSPGLPGNEIEELAKLPDDQIDTSEIAEILDWSDAKRVFILALSRGKLRCIWMPILIDWFKANAPGGRGYQSDINSALREHVKRIS